MTGYKAFFIALLAGLSMTPSQSALALEDTENRYSNAVSPVFGYTPIYGVILGGAWFRYPASDRGGEPHNRQDVIAQGTLGGQFSIQAQQGWAHWRDGWHYRVRLSWDNFFDYEFPQGQSSYQRYQRWQLRLNNEIAHDLSEVWSVFARAQTSAEQHEREGDRVFGFPGLGVRYDSRDSDINSRRGGYFSISGDAQPDALHGERLPHTGWRAGFDARWYRPMVGDSVLALRATAEATDGTLFDAELGGDRQLRGYVARRFVGVHSLAAQTEWRFPVYRWVSGVAFMEAGAIGQASDWTTPSSMGGGLRFGLPPDGRMKVRVDYGIADNGEQQFFVNFNQVF